MPTIGELWEINSEERSQFLIAEVNQDVTVGVGLSGNRIRFPSTRIHNSARFIRSPANIFVLCSVPSCNLPGWFGVNEHTFCPLHVPIGIRSSLTSDLRTTSSPYWEPLECFLCGNPNTIPHWSAVQLTSCPRCGFHWAVCTQEDEALALQCLTRITSARSVLFNPASHLQPRLDLPFFPSSIPPQGHFIICSRNHRDHLSYALVEGSKWVTGTGSCVVIDSVNEDSVHFYTGEVRSNSIMTKDDFLIYHRPLFQVEAAQLKMDGILPVVGQEWLRIEDNSTLVIRRVETQHRSVIVEDREGKTFSILIDEFNHKNRWSRIIRRSTWDHLLGDDE